MRKTVRVCVGSLDLAAPSKTISSPPLLPSLLSRSTDGSTTASGLSVTIGSGCLGAMERGDLLALDLIGQQKDAILELVDLVLGGRRPSLLDVEALLQIAQLRLLAVSAQPASSDAPRVPIAQMQPSLDMFPT